MKNLTYIFMFLMFFTSCKTLKLTGEYLDNPPSVVPKVALSTDLNRNNWQHLDPINDSVPGMSVDKAYTELIKDSEGQTVVVAVLDTGIDIKHEDLKGNIWTNKKEIPGNNIDDDKNGFVDDVYGWNFLGEAYYEQLELTRLLGKGEDFPEKEDAQKDYDKRLAEARGEETLKYYLNYDFKGRTTGDDPDNFDQTYYGDNKVEHSREDESHGTHVAGIIAAARNNNLGMKGVANNVQIMTLRVVPYGDE